MHNPQKNSEVLVADCIQTPRKKHKIKKSEYLFSGTIPVIDQGQEFIGGYINDLKRVYDGDLPVIVFGDHTCTLKYVDFPFAVGADGTQLIRPTKDFDIRYLYYALRDLSLEHFGYQRHFKYLKTSKIFCPPLPTQRKIAAILSAYDDLIENNTRRIKILEDMAQTFYQEWFVHFRFPGHEDVPMVESALGPIPQGWEVKKVKEIVKRLKAGKIYKEIDINQTGRIIVIDQSRAEFLGFHDNQADHNASPKAPIIIFGDHTCKMQLMVAPFSLGPNVIPLIAQGRMPVGYLYFLISSLVKTREYKRYWTELSNKIIAAADSKTREQFSNFTVDIFQQIEVLKRKNQNLRHIRDLLLPKLISGEIDVSEFDIDTNGIQPAKSGTHIPYPLTDRLHADEKILGGKPVIKGTRLAVAFILDLLKQGWTEKEIVENYPSVAHEDIDACRAYEGKVTRASVSR